MEVVWERWRKRGRHGSKRTPQDDWGYYVQVKDDNWTYDI